ncbi:MAG: nuclear transport factor 2 family protein [Coriobacteriales bacterium]|jgi:hypothetical protein|nr:nuclear transport factor 2 family protein [Coriobacteriales bacterium]
MSQKTRTPKEVYYEFARTWTALDIEGNSAVVHPDCTYHGEGDGDMKKPAIHEMHKQYMENCTKANYEILDIIEEGDKVAARVKLTSWFKDGTVMTNLISEYDICKDGMFYEGWAMMKTVE